VRRQAGTEDARWVVQHEAQGGGGRTRPESSCAAACSRDCSAESDGLAPYVQIARGKPRPLRSARAGGCFASAQSFTTVQIKLFWRRLTTIPRS